MILLKRLNLRLLVGISLGLLLIGVLVYRNFYKSSTNSETYQTSRVERGVLVVSVKATGQILSNTSSVVSTNASGVVKKIYVKDGQEVKVGSKIAELDLDLVGRQKTASAWSSYLSAKNSLQNARDGIYAQQSKLFAANQKLINDAVARGLASDDPTYIQQNADWLAAEASYKAQEESVKQAQSSLNSAWLSYMQSSSIIYAPISGKVSGLNLQIGSVIATGDSAVKIASVVTEAKPTVLVSLTDIDIPKVEVGDRASITLDAISDKTYTGTVISRDIVGSVSSGVTNYEVAISLDNLDKAILPNMSGSVNIIIDTKDNVLMVPVAAVTTANGDSSVKVMRNGKPQQVSVVVGLANDSQIEVKSGLTEGDEVVTGSVNTANKPAAANQSQSVFSSLGGNRSFSGATGTVRISR